MGFDWSDYCIHAIMAADSRSLAAYSGLETAEEEVIASGGLIMLLFGEGFQDFLPIISCLLRQL